jgi:hypothetical protein
LRAYHRHFALDSLPLPESAIQNAVFQHLAVRSAAHTFAFHVPTGGWRSPIEAAILKGQGDVPGVPDIIVIKDGLPFALELRPRADGRRRRRARRWKRCGPPALTLELRTASTQRCAG